MSGLAAFLAKERNEIFRTWKIWVIPGMLLFFGITSPLVALVAPKLIGSLAGSQPGVVIQLPDPTGLDGYAQFLKNLSQIVVIAVIIAGAGVVSSERSSGTAILVLTKPLSRAAFVGAKLISFLGLILVPTVVAAIVCVAVSRLVLPPEPVGGFVLAV
ncbi:MAG: ABC transporter permease subunit, partial [Gemmatimonadales bacterium]